MATINTTSLAVAIALVCLSACNKSEPSIVVLDIAAAGDDAVILAQVREGKRSLTSRIVTRRGGALEMSEPIAPALMSDKGTVRVEGDQVIAVLVERKPEETTSVRVAVMASDSLRITWSRQLAAPGSWEPVLEVGPERIYTWAGGPIALDRETGETVWWKKVEATPDLDGPARRLRLIGDALQVKYTSSFQLLDRHGSKIAAVETALDPCLDGDSVVGFSRSSPGRLIRANAVTGVVAPLGSADPRLATFRPRRCVRVGTDLLFLGEAEDGRLDLGAVFATRNGQVRWRAAGPGELLSTGPGSSLSRSPRMTRYVPVQTFVDGKEFRIALLDLAEGRWALTDLTVDSDDELIPFEDCWVVASRYRSVAVDPRTGRVMATRDYTMSVWKKRGPYLWLVDLKAKHPTRLHGCTLARMPF